MAVARLPSTSGVVFGTHTPGEDRDGRPVFRYFTPDLLHSIVVNAAGRRFADDSFHMALVEGIAGGRDGPRTGPRGSWSTRPISTRTRWAPCRLVPRCPS